MPHATTSDGQSIYWERHGEAGDPVLLLMGLGSDLHLWERQVPAFAARHRLLLVDNRGVGRSSKPPRPYSTARMAEDAVAALDAAGIARAHVVGLSMGGMIAQELALSHADRVGALVLAATYAKPGEEIAATTASGSSQLAPQTAKAGAPSLLSMFASGAIDLRGPRALDVRQLLQFLMPLVVTPAFMEREREWLRALLDRSLGYGVSMEGLLAQVEAVLAHDTTARLPSLRVPTLVITSDRDRLVPPRHSDELARLIPGARLVTLPRGVHGFNLETPDAFNDAVLAFLAEHPLA